ncbi:ABC transporter G family member 40 [Forsythia ovata]|uniref:ABC transporter G family member 40 n=1 Tax=Forsythia ovata TaxID=205694 RepID=A0ABD1WX81_9LAMI
MLLLLFHQVASALFRFIGAAGRTMIVANTFGLFALLLLFALGGFVLSRGIKRTSNIQINFASFQITTSSSQYLVDFANDVKGRWIWGYWSSPMMYAKNAILVNEFRVHRTQLEPTFDKPQATILEESEDDATSGSSSVRTDAKDANQNKKRGMILPFEPHSITFDDVQYSVDMPPEMRAQGDVDDKLVLLKGASGAFRPGVLTAMMGVSGAGKTTLMDVLAGRKTGGYIERNITISGYPKKQETFARISGYCEQNDIHSPYITVYESLLYSAGLRLPKEVNAKSRKMFIEEVILVELIPLRGS